jgi:hypothetical protein
MEEHRSFHRNYRKERRSVFSEEIPRTSMSRQIPQRCRGDTEVYSWRVKLRTDREVDPSQSGPLDLHVVSCIGVSQIESPTHFNGNCDSAKRDILTDLNHPSVGTRVGRSKEVRVQSIGSLWIGHS